MTGRDPDPDPTAPSADPSDDHPLDPEVEAQVRRLLSQTRHDEPMPDHVVARLDGVLASLVEARDEQDAPVPAEAPTEPLASAAVVPLASRRRHARRLLLVAAAVVVAGVGVGRLVATAPTSGNDDADSASAGAGAAESFEDADGGAAGAAPSRPGADLTGIAPVPIGSETFADDVAALGRDRLVDSATLSAQGDTEGRNATRRRPGRDGAAADRGTPNTWFDCTPAPWGAGRLVPVLYDDEPAVLAFRPRTGDSRVIELLQCGSGDVLRSLTVPATR